MDYSFTPASAKRPPADYRALEPPGAPAVSIVTPFFNPGAAFAETAATVFAQSLTAWEWIVVDDGSDDPVSLEALARAEAADARVRVVRHPENRGISAARNSGYAAARAEFVLQLDADDLLEPTAAEKWLWYLYTHPASGFVNGHTVAFGAVETVWTRGFQEADEFLERNFVGGRGMVRRRVHAAAGGYDESLRLVLEDWDFWLRCADAGHWGETIDEALDWQRRRGTDVEQWPVWDDGPRQAVARERMRQRHAGLLATGLPRLERRGPQPFDEAPLSAPCENRLLKPRRRLLLVVPWLVFGGTDRFSLDLIDQLVARGWDVTVATTRVSDDAWRYEYLRRTPDVFMLHRFLPLAAYPAFLRYLLASRQPDVVLLSHSELGYHLLPALRAWRPETALVDYLHIVEPEWKNGGYPRLSALFHEQLDLTLCASASARSWMVGRGAEADRVEVVPIGVDVGAWRADAGRREAVRAGLGLEPGTPALLYVARLCEQKRPLLFARVLGALARRGVLFRALVAGDGELRSELERELVRQEIADRVTLLGAVETERMRDLYVAADLLFLPSQREGIAASLYEAMASGLPVVSTAVGGQSELVAEGCGLLLPFGESDADVERFADALQRALASPELRRAWGDAARRRVEQSFRLDQTGDQMVAAFARASRLREDSPRPRVSTRFAAALSELAIESSRLNEVCDWLWFERVRHRQEAEERAPAASPPPTREPAPDSPGDDAPASVPVAARPGARWFARLKARTEPLYVWGIRRGWTWLVPLKERVKSRLVGDE